MLSLFPPLWSSVNIPRHCFYANLFSTEGWDKNIAEELVTHMDRKLTCDESEDLEKDLTINEIKKIYLNNFV
jgi:hypothetical protein